MLHYSLRLSWIHPDVQQQGQPQVVHVSAGIVSQEHHQQLTQKQEDTSLNSSLCQSNVHNQLVVSSSTSLILETNITMIDTQTAKEQQVYSSLHAKKASIMSV